MTPFSLGIITVPSPGTPVPVGTTLGIVVGTEVGAFNISALNDNLQIGVDSFVAQSITLTHGAARTATQVAADINGGATGLTASVAANKIVIASNSIGPTSQITVDAATGNAVLGLSVGTYLGSENVRACKLRLVPLKDNSGDIYVGVKVNFDRTTGDGLIDHLMKPLANPSTLDSLIVEAQDDQNVLHTIHYFIDADNANDGVIASIWVM